jgi:ABC-type sugar transport system ATPase subunit
VPPSFYRGFPESVKKLSRAELLFDQLIHYTRTYGFGNFDSPDYSRFEEDFERCAFREEVTPRDFSILCEEEAKEVLKELGLGEHLNKLPSQISGGQDQRLSLASVFINKWSNVFLYDEPTSALDNANDMIIVEMVKRHQKKYGTIEIMITHEEHVYEGLDATILDFTPEFRLHPPKVKFEEVVSTKEDDEANSERIHLEEMNDTVTLEGATENDEKAEVTDS